MLLVLQCDDTLHCLSLRINQHNNTFNQTGGTSEGGHICISFITSD